MNTLKVVVTGASGFLGQHVLKLLYKQNNIEVIAVTRKKIPGWFNVSDYSESPAGDVLIHLAESNDRLLVSKSSKVYKEKILNTLTALLTKRYSRIVYASSSVLYGDESTHLHDSNDPIQINDTYTNIKHQSELAVLKISSGIVVRLANVYGPNMSSNNVISTILQQIPGKGSLNVMNTSSVRDFIWVEDAAEGIVSLAIGDFKKNNVNRLFNLGTGVGTSIKSLAELALNIAKQSDRLVNANNVSNIESSLILDFSRTTSACGWKPRTSLRQGLTKLLQIKLNKIKYE